MSEQIAEHPASDDSTAPVGAAHRRTSKLAIVGAGAVGSTMA